MYNGQSKHSNAWRVGPLAQGHTTWQLVPATWLAIPCFEWRKMIVVVVLVMVVDGENWGFVSFSWSTWRYLTGSPLDVLGTSVNVAVPVAATGPGDVTRVCAAQTQK
jgi:hypothetical protein